MTVLANVEDVQALFKAIAKAKTSSAMSQLIKAIQPLKGNDDHIEMIKEEITFCCQEHFPSIAGNKQRMNIMFGAIYEMKQLQKMPFDVVKAVRAYLKFQARANKEVWVTLYEDFKSFVEKREAALRKKPRKEKVLVLDDSNEALRSVPVDLLSLLDDFIKEEEEWKRFVDAARQRLNQYESELLKKQRKEKASVQSVKQSNPFKNYHSRYIESSIDPNVVYVVEEDAMGESKEEDPDALEPDFDVSDSTFLRRISKEERHKLRLQALARGWIRRVRKTQGLRCIHCPPVVLQERIAKYAYFKEEDGVGRAHCPYCAKLFISQ